MATKINYGTKAPFQDKPEIPVSNKVTANDMNEIKEAVNGNADELDTAKEDIENLQRGQGTNNTDITDLKNRVSTLEGDNKTNKTNINNLKTDNETNKSNIQALQKDNTTNKQDISDIKEEQQTQNNNIKNLQKNDAQQDKSIEALQKENTELKEECSRLRQDLNAFPSGQAEGEYITLQDSADSRFNKFRIGGNSKQETREGKNLTNYKDWTIIGSVEEITKQEDDEIVCEIPANNSYGIKDIERTLKPNTAYTACVDYEFSQTLTSNCGLRVAYNGNYTAFSREGIVTFTTDETGLARMQFYVGMPYSGEAGILTVKNIRLYEGTYTKETIPEYEEYGAMPSPEYPSEIQNIEGNINVSVCNKNLFNKNTISYGSINYLTGAYLNSDSKQYTSSDFIKVKENTTYYCNYVVFGSSTYGLAFYDKDKNFISGSQLTNLIITPENAEYIRFCFRNENYNGTNITDVNTVQFEENTQATDYVAHQEQVVTFPLSQGQKLMLGDYLAKDGIHHVRKQNKPNELGGWNINIVSQQTQINTISFRYQIVNAMNSNSKLCLSNLFKGYKTTEIYNVDKEGIWIASNYIYVRINRNRLDTEDVEGFENFLVKNNIIVEYPLEEEEIEPYTEEQQKAYNKIVQTAKSYKNVTNIFSPDPVSPIASVNYRKDIDAYIDNKLANVNSQILNIAGGN